MNNSSHFSEIAISRMKEYCLHLQQRICTTLSAEEMNPASFHETDWQHATGGGGKTCSFVGGQIVEKAAVNFSHVYGQSLPRSVTEKRQLPLERLPFQALGVSVIVHPYNPYVPTSHMNVRLIVIDDGGVPKSESKEGAVWWFGGGFDLTPYYGFEEDCQTWHEYAKKACDHLHKEAYLQYKKWCDNYFYLAHRKEPRGIGGIFFDDLNDMGFERCFYFVRAVGDAYLTAYQQIFSKRKQHVFGQRERDFQAYRRGRYVEFNLLYDRGTLFGLQSGGRVESILLSLPPHVSWRGNEHESFGVKEKELYEKFLQTPRDWI